MSCNQCPPAAASSDGPPYAIPVAPLTSFYAQPMFAQMGDGGSGSGSGGSGDDDCFEVKIIDVIREKSNDPKDRVMSSRAEDDPFVTCIGRKMHLRVEVENAPADMRVEWDILAPEFQNEPTAVTEYDLDYTDWLEAAEMKPLKDDFPEKPPGDPRYVRKAGSEVTFYWVGIDYKTEQTPSRRDVEVKVTIGGQTCTAVAPVLLHTPMDVSMLVNAKPKEGISIGQAYRRGKPAGSGESLIYGTGLNTKKGAGVVFTGRAKAPPGFCGKLGNLQVINSARSQRAFSDKCWSRPRPRKHTMLDNIGGSPFYWENIALVDGGKVDGTGTVVGGNGVQEVPGYDSPWHDTVRDGVKLARVRIDEECQTFLMFRPDPDWFTYPNDNSIFVSVAKCRWGWKANAVRATKTGVPALEGEEVKPKARSGRTVELPEWDGVIQQHPLQLTPCENAVP